MESKKQIRAAVLEKRTGLSVFAVEKKSCQITKYVTTHPWFQEAQQILVYIDFRKEVSTRGLIEECWSAKKQVFVPKVEGKNMNFYRIKSWEEVKPGVWGILEPIPELPVFARSGCKPEDSQIVIMPGVAFDAKRNRIGYGGGYYDRYFEQYESIRKIAVAFECQIVEEIPSENTDIRPDCVITEKRVIQ